jgi:hypothetical protein
MSLRQRLHWLAVGYLLSTDAPALRSWISPCERLPILQRYRILPQVINVPRFRFGLWFASPLLGLRKQEPFRFGSDRCVRCNDLNSANLLTRLATGAWATGFRQRFGTIVVATGRTCRPGTGQLFRTVVVTLAVANRFCIRQSLRTIVVTLTGRDAIGDAVTKQFVV